MKSIDSIDRIPLFLLLTTREVGVKLKKKIYFYDLETKRIKNVKIKRYIVRKYLTPTWSN